MNFKLALSLILIVNSFNYAMDDAEKNRSQSITMSMSCSKLLSCSVLFAIVTGSPFAIHELWSSYLNSGPEKLVLLNNSVIVNRLQPDMRNLSSICSVSGVPSPAQRYENGIYHNFHATPNACQMYADALQIVCDDK